MGLIKWLCKRFSCKSGCMFNPEQCDKDLLDIDLRQYVLKDDDLKVIQNIRNKRASKHKYVHNRPIPWDSAEV